MIHVAVRHRAQDGKLIRHPRQPRKMLTDMEPRDIGRNRLELTAIFHRGMGLQIPGVLMSRAAPHEQHDARLGLAARGFITGTQQLGQTQTKHTERACAQDFTPSHRGGGEKSGTSSRRHRGSQDPR